MWTFLQQRLDLGDHHGEEVLFDRRHVQVSKRLQVDFRGGGSESCKRGEVDAGERGGGGYPLDAALSR